MGRRKIEIQPIRDERNRTVTFIKRKAGLFKKAHELAVLCQVDVAVIILGSNNTFYEFSSVDMKDMIEYYERADLNHDIKQPSDYGAYKKKTHIKLNENSGKRGPRKNCYPPAVRNDLRTRPEQEHDDAQDEEDEEEEEEEEEQDGVSPEKNLDSPTSLGPNMSVLARSALKRPDDINDRENEEEEEEEEESFERRRHSSKKAIPLLTTNKKLKLDHGGAGPPKFNPLQQHVQRQFQNLYHAASSTIPSTGAGRVSNTVSENGAITLSRMSPDSISQHDNATITERAMHPRPPAIHNTPPPPTSTSTPSTMMTTGSYHGSGPKSDLEKNPTRPVLRVQIPSNNNTYTSAIKSESSSASSMLENTSNSMSNVANLISKNTSSIRYDPSTSQQVSPKRQTPVSSSLPNGSSLLMNEQGRMNGGTKAPAAGSYGLPPMFSGSPVFVPYLATPSQANTNNSSNAGPQPHPSPYMLQRPLQQQPQALQRRHNQHQLQIQQLKQHQQQQLQLQLQQQQQQQQQQQVQLNKAQSHPQLQAHTQNISHVIGRVTSPPLPGEHSAGPLTGSLPSKFAHDLMVPSPSGSMSMFQDWSLGPKNAPHTANHSSSMNTNHSHDIPSSTYNNGGSGLTPYIMANQTPLGNRFFNFSGDADDKSGNHSASNSNPTRNSENNSTNNPNGNTDHISNEKKIEN